GGERSPAPVQSGCHRLNQRDPRIQQLREDDQQQLGLKSPFPAKALGNGLPIGAMLTRSDIASSFTVGTHASTFGGNPVAAAAGVAVMETMLAKGFFANIQEKSSYFIKQLEGVAAQFPHLCSGVRGSGMLLALVLTEKGIEQGAEIVQQLFERGCLINFAGMRVLRFIPPLTVTHEDIDQLIVELSAVLHEVG
ncbi:MAG: aminotransferase class III-fold pyridoxal phosphate-dependent enzyme, partial [Candidatus Electrothrix sp. AS4_5]|nr:aminotransferase class III-fold pyridoxal phosphate-dependent enzyme [Candidatus Electrothrix gigas]